MKHKISRCVLSAALAAAAALPAVFAAGESRTSSFYQQLSTLVNSQDTSGYFSSIELSLNSDVLRVDGTETKMDVMPQVQNERTMLPIRPVAEAAGATVDYEADTGTAVIVSSAGTVIRCPIGLNYILVNGEPVVLDGPSYAENGRTYLPVRAISEAMGLEVSWIQSTSTVSISAPYQTCRVVAWYKGELDISNLNATQALHHEGGLWVLQFDTPAAAENAVRLLEVKGIPVNPDYMARVDGTSAGSELPRTVARGEAQSWGVAACKFDEFVAEHMADVSRSAVVAVVDTGVDAAHPFLQGRVLPNGIDLVNYDGDPSDEHYHGTHVAGTVVDCCGDADVKILPVRVLNEFGLGGSSEIVSGIIYAADEGADVINLSLGEYRMGNDVWDEAIRYAVEKGSLVVVAAGNNNDNTETFCPAHLTLPGVIVVSAGDATRNKAATSNYGNSVDIMAPGYKIASSVPGGGTRVMNGTSMAAPHVSAAAALLDIVWGKSLTPAQLEEKVLSGTTNQMWTNRNEGYGFLDMSRADVPDSDMIVAYRCSPESMTLQEGFTEKLTVTAEYASGKTRDITGQCSFSSTDLQAATVDAGGTVTGVKTGTAMITMGALPNGVPVPEPVTVTVVNVDPAEAYEKGQKSYNEKNYVEAVKWYRLAADQGYAAAQNSLGYCYYSGEGVPQSYEDAVKWYGLAAGQGEALAQNRLGYCYYYGYGVPQSYEDAVKWLQLAAGQGNASAQARLGYCYYFGHGVPQSYEDAVKWYRLGVDQGNAGAQNNLGLCYENGHGVQQNYEEAVKYYMLAAGQGYAAAQNNLGACYFNGTGVPENFEEAVKWYRLAIDQGSIVAKNNLGDCYDAGLGVPQSSEEAVKWYRLAAEQGYMRGQYNLGRCYEYGRGVQQDQAQAIEWYRKAAEQGHSLAQYALERLGV